MTMLVRCGLAAVLIARVAAAAPAPAVHDAGKPHVLDFVEVRGDYHLRHSGVMMHAYAITPDGKRAATGSLDGSVVVWDLHDGHVVRDIATPHHNVYAVALSTDGTKLASTGWDGTLRLWSVATGKQLWEIKAQAFDLRFSLDDTQLLGDRQGQLGAWNVATGAVTWDGKAVERSHWECNEQPRGAAVLPDGVTAIDLAATGCHEERMGDVVAQSPYGYAVTASNIVTGKLVRKLGGVGAYPQAVGVSADGKRVGVVTSDAISVYDVAGKQAVVTMKLARALDNEAHVAPAPDPKLVVTWDVDAIIAWDVAAGAEKWRVTTKTQRPRVTFAGADTLAVVAGTDCFALELATGKERWRRARCTGMAASPTKLVLERGPSAIDVVAPATGASVLPAQKPDVGPTGMVRSIAADATRVALAAGDASVWLWSGATPVRLPDTYERAQVHFMADGRLAVVNQHSLDDARIDLYRGDPPARVASDNVPRKDRLGLGAVIAGDHLVVEEVREADYLRTIVDLTGQAKPVHPEHWHSDKRARTMRNEALNDGALTRDLGRAYIYGNDQKLHAWSMRTGMLEAEAAPTSTMHLAPIALSPDETHVITATGAVEMWRAKDLLLERTFAGPKGGVWHVAVSPDGKLVVAAAPDGLFVWQLDGTPLATVDFAASREAPTALAFTPDGKTLWVGTSLGNVHRFTVHAP